MARKFFPSLLISLGMLLQTSPSPLHALKLGFSGLIPVAVAFGNIPVSTLQQIDLDGDNSPETINLYNGQMSIFSHDQTVWQSPLEWQIIQTAIADLNRDGKPEVILLLWRPFSPWPTDQWLPNGGRIAGFQNDEGQSCHIILIGWSRGGYHELWAGSAMADPISSFATADINDDEAQELVALEGRYTDSKSAPAQTLKVWEWNGFGFTVISSVEGRYRKMALVQAKDGHILILVP
jgi:hypothetical protein